MSTFLLKCHSDIKNLRISLNRFERRVKLLKYPFQFLEHLLTFKMEDKLFYWPSMLDTITIAEASSSIPPGERISMDQKNQDIHLYILDITYFTTITTTTTTTTTQQRSQNDVNDDDIVYPTFIGILYDRQLDSMKKLMEIQSKSYNLTTKSGHIHVKPNSGFLDTLENDLFTMSSTGIFDKYKRTSFTRFVAENRETMNHFPASSITPFSHKAIFNLNGVILDAKDINGGSIILYPPSDKSEKYFVCLSDGSFHIEDNDSCIIYTQSTSDSHRMDGKYARWIDIAKFRRRRTHQEYSLSSSLCMIESSDKMVIRFNAKARCFLYTSGRIHLDLTVVGSMEFWSKSRVTQFPFYYHIHSTRMMTHQAFLRYVNNLPPLPRVDPRMDDYLQQFNDGSVLADMKRNEETGQIDYLSYHMKVKTVNRPIYDQHDSFAFFDFEPQITFLKNMKIYYAPSKPNDIYPIFTAITKRVTESKQKKRSVIVEIDEEVELSVARERYKVGENEYYVNGLYFPKKKDEIIAYFYLNSTNNHILFILPYASVSHTLNTEPIPVEPQYSGPIIHIDRNNIPYSKPNYSKPQSHNHHRHSNNNSNNSKRANVYNRRI